MSLRRHLPNFRQTLLALLLAAVAGAVLAQAVNTRALQQQGEVMIEAGNTLRTGRNGLAQIALADGSVLALSAGSELVLPPPGSAVLVLRAGGLRLDASAAAAGWRVELPGRSILTNGFLRLQFCAEGCPLPPGLYGRVVGGEAVLEYQGGRSVLRNRSFYWSSASTRPEILARVPAVLDGAADHVTALRVRAESTDMLRTGLEAFRDGNDDLARQRLADVRRLVPGEPLVDYYLGLIALRREENEAALQLLQQYARQDPEGAASREVSKTLTLLSSNQLQQEVATAIAREKEVVAAAPEPNSIAVSAFVNRGDEAYRAMAKGIAAMIIADLSKVPGLKVLEREKVQVLMNEMKLGDAGLADPASAVRSGRLMRAEKVIVGNFEVQ